MTKKQKTDPRQSEAVHGWILVAKEDGGWHIAWHEVFRTRKQALAVTDNGLWTPPFRAVRGSLQVSR